MSLTRCDVLNSFHCQHERKLSILLFRILVLQLAFNKSKEFNI